MCPCDEKPEMPIGEVSSVYPMGRNAVGKHALTHVDRLRILPPMPDDVDAAKTLEVGTREIDREKIAPLVTLAFDPGKGVKNCHPLLLSYIVEDCDEMTQPSRGEVRESTRYGEMGRWGGAISGGRRQHPVNSGSIENAQAIAAHESPRTTGLYVRTDDEVILDDVERIGI